MLLRRRKHDRESECRAQFGNHRVHRVATPAFWRTFHHEGKISPGWWGWGVHAHPLSLHLPSPVKFSVLSSWVGRYTNPVLSLVKICTLCWKRIRSSEIGSKESSSGLLKLLQMRALEGNLMSSRRLFYMNNSGQSFKDSELSPLSGLRASWLRFGLAFATRHRETWVF